MIKVVRGAYFIEHAPVNVWGSIVFIEATQVKINTRMAEAMQKHLEDQQLNKNKVVEVKSSSGVHSTCALRYVGTGGGSQAPWQGAGPSWKTAGLSKAPCNHVYTQLYCCANNNTSQEASDSMPLSSKLFCALSVSRPHYLAIKYREHQS